MKSDSLSASPLARGCLRGKYMRRLLPGLFLAAVLWLVPATSSAAVVQNVTVPLTATILNPCTGDTINFTGNFHFLAAMTPHASGWFPLQIHDHEYPDNCGAAASRLYYHRRRGDLFAVNLSL